MTDMDDSYTRKNELSNPHIHLIMDNDSGYASNNLDQESNSDSLLDNSDTSTVGILRSFLPKEKPVFLSEDALLECPDIGNKFGENTLDDSLQSIEYSPDLIVDSSVKSDRTYLPSFHSSENETEVSDSSMILPLVDPIYFDLNTNMHSRSSIIYDEYMTENLRITASSDSSEPFLGFDEASKEATIQVFQASLTQLTKITNGSFSEIQIGVCGDSTDFSKSSQKVYLNLTQEARSSSEGGSCSVIDASCETESCSSKFGQKDCLKLVSSNVCDSLEYSKSCSTSKLTVGINSETSVLSNVTNTCDNTDKLTNPVETLNKIFIRRRTISSKEKENISQPEVFKTPNKGVKRKLNDSVSPDLFSDDECSKVKPLPSPKMAEERYVHKLDHVLLRRVQKKLNGVPPPPQFTMSNFTVDNILQKLETNKMYFWTKENSPQNNGVGSGNVELESLNDRQNCSFRSTASILIEGALDVAVHKTFPQILEFRHHGLHYNRNKLSEEIEHLCDKYARRYIGAETQSTCCAVEVKYNSPAKRKGNKHKWALKSPGRRLSHLARRRITFSSANLQANSSSSATSRARQILIDYKKVELLNHKKSPRKTPRKSPSKSPAQGRTPSSSAKKKLRMRFRLLSGDFKEAGAEPSSSIASSKRALFQSPDNENKFRNILLNSSSSSFNSDLNNRGIKRSLFSSPNRGRPRSSLFSSPSKKSPFKNLSSFEKKRKRDEADDNSKPSKLFRSQSSAEADLKPQSSFSRAKSDGILSSSQPVMDLTAAHKKKLQWAVYESLKLQNITTSHPNFKTYASVLARVTRRFILSSNIRSEGGTSERMLRIARHHSFAVVKGKSVEEIMGEYNRSRAKSFKPQGYIAPEDFQKCLNKEFSATKESALKDRSNTGDSLKNISSRSTIVKPESRIDRIRKVINFEDNR